MLCSEHLRKQSLCLHRDLGDFSASAYGDRPSAQPCCSPSSSHPEKAPTHTGQSSMAGHPGKSQSDRLARSSQAGTQAGTPAALNNCPEHFKNQNRDHELKKKKGQNKLGTGKLSLSFTAGFPRMPTEPFHWKSILVSMKKGQAGWELRRGQVW